MFMWLFVKGWALTLLGPAAFAVRAWLPGGGLARALKVGVYLGVLGVGVWGGIRVTTWWHGDRLTEQQAQVKCDMAIAEAEIAAKRRALDARERLLKDREQAVEQDETSLASLMVELKEARDAASTQPQTEPGVFVRDGDEWLRAWRARHLDRARHR